MLSDSMLLKAVLLALFIATSEAYDGISSRSTSCPADEKGQWSYRGDNGPESWGETYPDCYGERQSPVAIDPSTIVKDESLPPLVFNFYDQPIHEAVVYNKGNRIEVVPQADERRYLFLNEDKYWLFTSYFHWGVDNRTGSEHIVGGVQYAMEMQLVHVNADHQVAIVAALLQEQEQKNEELQKIVEKLSEVPYNDTDADLESSLILSNLLPANPISYYLYEGSLTTPKCLEDVTWFVVEKPVLVGPDQMEEFRKLFSTTEDDAADGCKISGNYRPVQPLNGRQVYHRSQ